MNYFNTLLIIALCFLFLSCNNTKTESTANTTQVFNYKINRFVNNSNDKGRGSNEFIVYMPEYNNTTKTGLAGLEAVVENNIIVKIGENNNTIPKNGFVISGNGDAARWIARHLKPFMEVEIKENEFVAKETPEGFIRYAKQLISKAEDRMRKSKANHKSINTDSLLSYLGRYSASVKKAEAMLRENNLEEYEIESHKALAYAKEFYYRSFPSYDNELRTCWYRMEESSPDEVDKMIKRIADLGFNAICPETIYEGNSLYPKAHRYLTQNKNFTDWDPMQALVESCKKYNIKLIPWIEVYFVGFEDSELKDTKKEWLGITKEGKTYSDMEPGYHFFCPSRPQVREFWLEVYKTLLEKYKLDGFQLDYIRYPVSQPFNKGYCYCEYCRDKFMKLHNADPIDITPENVDIWEKWNQYRISQIDTFVTQVRSFISDKYPNLRLSADVFPSIDHSLNVKFQNWGQWLNDNKVDDIFVMSYYDVVESVLNDSKFLKTQLKNGHKGYVGLGSFIGMTPETLLGQIEAAREGQANGVALFSLGYLQQNPRQMEALKKGPFRVKAIAE